VQSARQYRGLVGAMRPGSSPVAGAVLGLVLVVAVSALLLPLRDDISVAGPALALVLPVVAAGLLGGGWAAVTTAFASGLAFNLAFILPYGTLKIDAVDDAIALGVFVVVALAVGMLVSLEDERRRAAEQRTREVTELYDELGRVASERERLAAETARLAAFERVDEQRAALLRSVSHDLRTPLASIRAIASDLRDGTAYDEETERELLGTVCDESERLDRLVANLLSMSQIEAGALQPEHQAVDVEELVCDRARRLGARFGAVRLRVELGPDLPLVRGDYSQLDQVVTNLLDNAARFAPPRSDVVVRGAAVDGEIELRVVDAGPGVPAERREDVFRPFHRGERGGGTSGLGLAICKGIVEAREGAISVEESPGGGATFVVRLPVDARG
jgi:two-component system sensor histidine kinase KdpD